MELADLLAGSVCQRGVARHEEGHTEDSRQHRRNQTDIMPVQACKEDLWMILVVCPAVTLTAGFNRGGSRLNSGGFLTPPQLAAQAGEFLLFGGREDA